MSLEFVLECLEHGTRVDEVMAFHIHSVDFEMDTELISRLLDSCIKNNHNPPTPLQLTTTTEIFLENKIDHTHPELFSHLLDYLWTQCHVSETACACLKEIELTRPGLLQKRISSIKHSLEKNVSTNNASLLLLLLAITSAEKEPIQLNVISKTLDSLCAMSRWMRCEALHLLALNASSAPEHVLSHPRVLECLGVVTSPICLQAMFDFDRVVKTAAFHAHLDVISLAFARNQHNPKEWREFAMQLRTRAGLQTLPTPFDSFSFAPANVDSLWAVDDFWRDDTLRVAHKAFALYSQVLLYSSGDCDEHIAKNIIDHVLLRNTPSRAKFLPFIVDLVQTSEPLIWRIAPSLAKCEHISDLFPIVRLLLPSSYAIAALDAFVDGFEYRASANWEVVAEYLDMCYILLRGLRNKLKTSPTAVSILRLVRKMRMKSQVDFILWDACDQIERWFMLDFDDNESTGETEEVNVIEVVDFSEYFELKRVARDNNTLSVEWKHEWSLEKEMVVGMEIYVDLEQTSSACYDFSLEPTVTQISTFGMGDCKTFSFTLPKSELCLPVRVFFSCMATSSDVTYCGSLGSISYELEDLFVRVARVPAAFTPVARVCICLQERPLQRVLDFIRATFGTTTTSKNGHGEDDISWKLCVYLPPNSHLAFNLHYHVPTLEFTARVQTDLWLVLPELDKLFQRI